MVFPAILIVAICKGTQGMLQTLIDNFHVSFLLQRCFMYRSAGKLLYALGLKQHPPIIELLTLIAGASASVRASGVRYLHKHLSDYYRGQYPPQRCPPFLPAAGPNGEVSLCGPHECFSNPESSVFGFRVLQSEFREYARDLLVREHPTGTAVAERLLASPPSYEAASNAFGYCAKRMGDFSRSEWTAMKRAKIVPLKPDATVPKEQRRQYHTYADAVYFASSKDSTRSEFMVLFDTVEFSPEANHFLSS
jgi:hypothetical protein